MAERGGLAPHPAVCGTTSLAGKPGARGRFTFHGPGGRTCTRTGRGLSSLPLHWATPGMKNGGPGRTCTVNLPIQSRMLWLIELQGCWKCGRAPRTRTGCFGFACRWLDSSPRARSETWVDQPDLHRHCRLHRAGCQLLQHGQHFKGHCRLQGG